MTELEKQAMELYSFPEARKAYIKGYQDANQWISVEKRHLLPCYESGHWDGLRSDFMLLLNNKKHQHVGRCYSGTLDGSEFDCFYGTDDYEIENVTHWMPLPSTESINLK